MDAAEEDKDVQLQRASTYLIEEFGKSFEPFLWRTVGPGNRQIRRRVRAMETERLLRLLAPFQELPQLLDPYLEKFLPPLAEAYLATLRSTVKSNKPAKNAMLLMPVSAAICQLLYTFCKIRGEKVVVRFFNAETRNLELLLSAVEAATTAGSNGVMHSDENSAAETWTWEERYISLLWLSHLLLAPFDLATISSAGTDEIEKQEIPGLKWPENLPGVTLRVVPLALKYLASAGKERDAAKALLVRISMRKDMQELGLLDALVKWALSRLQQSAITSAQSTYYATGVLSYLGGVLTSSTSTSDMDPYLLKIFGTVEAISDTESSTFKGVQSSALARKVVIKIIRAIAIISLQTQSPISQTQVAITELVESTIGHLLEALTDSDTPVRLAASKALSIITLKLAPDMATQVVEAVLDSLNHNVLWVDGKADEVNIKIRDLSAVNPLDWHGPILTLSHLLYRHSPPASSLSDILQALLLALSFERRTTSGTSVGTNVRDAACFGIWALARRYTTADLQMVKVTSASTAKEHKSPSSIIQVLATELVVAASLDPAGNIRRGASAALQELIGRHPDVIAEGITVVQVVDYHAVALRSRAMLEVAPKAVILSPYYEDALVDGFLAWRGVGDGDAASRRNAAAAIGLLSKAFRDDKEISSTERILALIKRIEKQLDSLKPREHDERHGLLLSLASTMSSLTETLTTIPGPKSLELINKAFQTVTLVLCTAKDKGSRHPELTAEGVSRVILATVPLMRMDLIIRASVNSTEEGIKTGGKSITNHPSLSNETSAVYVLNSVAELELCFKSGILPYDDIVTLAKDLLMEWLRREEEEVIEAATEAAASLMLVVSPEQRGLLVRKWISELSESSSGRVPAGFTLALTAVFPVVEKAQQDEICQAILDRWEAKITIKSKVILLQSLVQGTLLDSHVSTFIAMIASGLDNYTIDGRGDVGSLIRVEALKAARRAFNSIPWNAIDDTEESDSWFRKPEAFGTLYGKVLRLSAEKLDRVRGEAQQTLAQSCRNESERKRFESFTISSFDYFLWLLDLQVHDWLSLPLFQYEASQWSVDLFEGLVSSADTGSEDLIRASRAALAEFCDRDSENKLPNDQNSLDFVCQSLFQVAKKNISNDRVLIPTLEAMSFLFDVGIMQRSTLSWPSVYLLVQKAHYKTGNVRKLDAVIKLYGGISQVYPEALQKLTSMLLHPFPKVRNHVADTLFIARGLGKGVNWTKATKEDLRRLKEDLEMQGHR